MADQLNVVGVAMCRPTWTYGTKIWMCCRQVVYRRGSALQTTNECAEAFDKVFASLIVPLLHEDAVYEGTWCHRVFPTPLSEDLGWYQGDYDSLRGGDLVPLQCAALLRLLPAVGARRRPAHMYLSGLAESDVVDGILSDGWLADAEPLVEACTVEHELLVGDPEAAIRIQLSVPLKLPDPLSFFASAEIPPQLATQRRRGDNGKATSMPYFPEQVFP